MQFFAYVNDGDTSLGAYQPVVQVLMREPIKF